MGVREDDIHRVVFDSQPSFLQLRTLAAKMFDLSEFRIKYFDEDGDWITVNSDRELNEAIEYLMEISPGKLSRFSVLNPGISGSVLFPSQVDSRDSAYGSNGPPGGPPGQSPFTYSRPPNDGYPAFPIHAGIPPIMSPYPMPDTSASGGFSAVPGAPLNMAPARAQQMQQPYPPSPESVGRSQAENHSPPKPAEPLKKSENPPVSEQKQELSTDENSSSASVPVGKGRYDAKFIRDNSIPDGTVLKPGQEFTKEWIMRNTGDRMWPAGTTLLWQTGDKLEQVGEPIVPNIHSCVTGNINVTLKAPTKPNRHVVSHYRLCLPNGDYFGNRIWLDIRTSE